MTPAIPLSAPDIDAAIERVAATVEYFAEYVAQDTNDGAARRQDMRDVRSELARLRAERDDLYARLRRIRDVFPP